MSGAVLLHGRDLTLGQSLLGLDWLRGELALLALLAAPIALLGLLALMRTRRVLEAGFAPPMGFRATVEGSRGRRLARVLLAAGSIAFASLAAAGPVLGYLERPLAVRGVELVLCVDTSRSMLARDVRPNRLERAKREVLGLLDARAGNRYAIVGFSGDARQVAPLSTDVEALAELLDRVDVDDNRVGGTDLGVALERALDLLDEEGGESQAIVLITDGEDLEGRGLEVAERATARGVRVFVVGVGTANGSKIPTLAPDGTELFLVGPDGQEVETRLEGDSLRRLAEATGGAYLSTEASPTPLESLYTQRIERLDAIALREGLERIPRDRFQWPLAVALLLAVCEVALRDRRAGTADRRAA